MANKRIDQPTGTSTVGHEWDGIEELDTPLPRWWLWTFYLTIAFSVGYVIAYPAWPMIDRATEGRRGSASSRRALGDRVGFCPARCRADFARGRSARFRRLDVRDLGRAFKRRTLPLATRRNSDAVGAS